VDWVTEDVIRERFNNGGYWLKVQSGQLVDLVKKTSHPSVPPASEPHCTHSQIVCYYTRNAKLVAEVHQYA
jgi:hypothetical protein